MLPKAGLASIGVLLNLVIVSIPLLARTNLPAYFTSPAIWMFYILISVFCLSEVCSGNSETDQSPTSTAPYLPHIVGLTLLALIWVSVFEFTGANEWLSIIAGSTLIAAGIALRSLSIATLNTQFLSQIRLQSNHSLTKSGIYAIIRHPSELGLLLIALGIPTLLSSPTGLYISVGLLAPLSLYRIWLEDRLLLDAFSDEFSIYKSTTPALFPRL